MRPNVVDRKLQSKGKQYCRWVLRGAREDAESMRSANTFNRKAITLVHLAEQQHEYLPP